MRGSCYISQNLSSKCLPYPHQQLGRKKSLWQVDFTHAPQCQKSCAFSSGHHPSASLEKWRQCIFYHISMVDSHVRSCLTVSWNDRMLNGARQCYQGRNLHSAVRLLWKSCTSCSSAEIDFCWTIPCQFVPWSMAYITADSCRIRQGQLFAINIQKCWSVLSFCSRIIQHLIAIMTCKTWCDGAGRW